MKIVLSPIQHLEPPPAPLEKLGSWQRGKDGKSYSKELMGLDEVP